MDTADAAIRLLRRYKNVILEGPPGTGKTFVVGQLARRWQQETGRPLLGSGTGKYGITFHPSTTYEAFIDGLRYDDGQGKFIRKDGFLLQIVDEALAHPEGDFLVLVDELNRANIPKVLGDVLLCMEPSKRSTYDASSAKWVGGMSVTLPYSGRQFSIPSNVYLLGTMNTSDRSISPMDAALRRRFGFLRVEPIMGSALAHELEAAEGQAAATRVARSIDELTNLNQVLRDCLGPDAALGHSYLFGVGETEGTTASTPDPLKELREAVQSHGSPRAFWLESRAMFFGAKNQMDLPGPSGGRQGIVDQFYPMSSQGTVVARRNPSGHTGAHLFDLHLHGRTLIGNSIEYNSGGSNFRLKLKGKTDPLDEGIGHFIPAGNLQHKLHVWAVRPDNTFDFFVLDSTPENISAITAISDWVERTPGPGGRDYGLIDLKELAKTTTVQLSADDDAEWMTWRYAILPQLIDTVTQLGVMDLLDPTTRPALLSHLGKESATDRLARFDDFLRSLNLSLREEGQGLSRAVVISEAPAVAAALPTDEDDAPDLSDPDESTDEG